MVKIVWTELAVSDLKEIHDYIALDSARYASITATKIFIKIQPVSERPYLGRMVPEFAMTSIREMIEGNYRIIYRIRNKNKIEVLRVFHTARVLKKKYLK
jgi:toxin ParE1/3/4